VLGAGCWVLVKSRFFPSTQHPFFLEVTAPPSTKLLLHKRAPEPLYFFSRRSAERAEPF